MNQIIIVEGKSDKRRLKEVFDNVITFETSGLGLDDNKINTLKRLQKDNELIVFTDPDGPGEKIRKKLNDNFENLKHAYLPNDKALSKNMKKIGVEHASDFDIKTALNNLYEISEVKENYTIDDLIKWNIYNDKNKRLLLCNKLNIAFGNNKKLVEQLNYFAINKDVITKVIKEINESSK